ncbi:Histone-lysine N-methyltransferase NSD2-like protein, partial [Daphnia magna]
HPKTNGLVERVNRTLTLAFCAFVNTTHDDWDLHLSAAAFAINTVTWSMTTLCDPVCNATGRVTSVFPPIYSPPLSCINPPVLVL